MTLINLFNILSCQQRISLKYLEWIPYDRFHDIEYIAGKTF